MLTVPSPQYEWYERRKGELDEREILIDEAMVTLKGRRLGVIVMGECW